MKTFRLFLLTSILMVLVLSSWAQIGVGDVPPGKVTFTAFTLQQPEKIKIEGTAGAFYDEWRTLLYYGWIIDSETRKIVWHMADRSDTKDPDYGEFPFKDEVSLQKGTYELYFTGAYYNRNGDWHSNDWNIAGSFSDAMGHMFGRNKEKFKSSLQEGLGITVSGQNLMKTSGSAVVSGKAATAIVSILKPDHNANVKKGFSLSAETSLKIYAIGEGNRDEVFDYAWIYDLDKRQRVWAMEYRNSDFAGGDEKNFIVNEKIKLPAGNYQVSYVSDDSHSYNDWNAMPPDDPQFSGITIWADSEADKKNVIAFKMPAEVKPVLQLTKVRDDDFVSQGLSVKSQVTFRVLCLGEESDNEMADNGWIMNAATREIVWDMNHQRTEHAGGAEKNKMVDGTITLQKGEYIVYYSTDGSHSYGDWNSGPPHEQDYYGITLWASKKEDLSKVVLFEPGTFKNSKVIVEIVRVRDDQSLNETFTLDKDTKLRIMALGEGDDGDMADYGWIKNLDNGKVVWEMTYRNTEEAGGDRKNRMYNDTIILPKGSYKVYYETDGSHSYRHWNASPPRDPEHYGISLMSADNN